MYHGPREQVVPFFESLGFKLPPRKGTADFLQEITSQKDQAVRLGTLHGSIWLIMHLHACLNQARWACSVKVCALALCITFRAV